MQLMSNLYYSNSGNGGRSRNSTAGGVFPCKLHDMIDYAERNNLDDIISWTPSGRSFIVHHPNRLVHQLLPLFFGLTKYRSFRRQLNIWSFETIHQNGSDTSVGSSSNRNNSNANRRLMFQHPYFLRGKRSICEYMGRETFKRTPSNKASSSSESSCSRRNSDARTSQDQLATAARAPSPTKSFNNSTNNAQPACNKVSLDDFGGKDSHQNQQEMINISGGLQLNKTWSNNVMFMNGRINSPGLPTSPPSSSSSSVSYTPSMQNTPMMMTMMSSECNNTSIQQVHPTLSSSPQLSLQNMVFTMNNNNNNISVNNNNHRISQSKMAEKNNVVGTGMTKNDGYPDKVVSNNITSNNNNNNHHDGGIAEFAGRSFHFVEIEE